MFPWLKRNIKENNCCKEAIDKKENQDDLKINELSVCICNGTGEIKNIEVFSKLPIPAIKQLKEFLKYR